MWLKWNEQRGRVEKVRDITEGQTTGDYVIKRTSAFE